MSVADNLRSVYEEIEKAKREAGRNDDVTLVAVTKYSTPEEVLEAARAGQTVFAENRVQMLREKWAAFDTMRENGEDIPEMHWHLIGQLQTNKVKYVVGRVELIHSCDREQLADEISVQSVRRSLVTDVLIEVNVSGEESKSGVSPSGLEELLRHCAALPGIRVRGLMTMAPLGADEDELTRIFTETKKLFIDMNMKKIYNQPMTTLSMGMSADFACAVRCGATMIRVGRKIFS